MKTYRELKFIGLYQKKLDQNAHYKDYQVVQKKNI